MQQRAPVGPFIVGLFCGFILGGLVLMPAAVLSLTAVVGQYLKGANLNYGFVVIYAAAVALGVWAIMLTRARLSFVAGLLGGAAVGLLGLTALCNSLMGAMGNMH